ncbi:hypothetical protein ACFXTH_001635 [Malus domestica]
MQIKKLDGSEFRNAFDRQSVRVGQGHGEKSTLEMVRCTNMEKGRQGKAGILLWMRRPITSESGLGSDTNSCLAQNARATSATFRKTFPLYFSLTFVPFVVFSLQKSDLEIKLTSIIIRQLDDVAGAVSGLAVKWYGICL